MRESSLINPVTINLECLFTPVSLPLAVEVHESISDQAAQPLREVRSFLNEMAAGTLESADLLPRSDFPKHLFSYLSVNPQLLGPNWQWRPIGTEVNQMQSMASPAEPVLIDVVTQTEPLVSPELAEALGQPVPLSPLLILVPPGKFSAEAIQSLFNPIVTSFRNAASIISSTAPTSSTIGFLRELSEKAKGKTVAFGNKTIDGPTILEWIAAWDNGYKRAFKNVEEVHLQRQVASVGFGDIFWQTAMDWFSQFNPQLWEKYQQRANQPLKAENYQDLFTALCLRAAQTWMQRALYFLNEKFEVCLIPNNVNCGFPVWSDLNQGSNLIRRKV